MSLFFLQRSLSNVNRAGVSPVYMRKKRACSPQEEPRRTSLCRASDTPVAFSPRCCVWRWRPRAHVPIIQRIREANAADEYEVCGVEDARGGDEGGQASVCCCWRDAQKKSALQLLFEGSEKFLSYFFGEKLNKK